MSTREKFVARFGEDDANRIEAAACMHENPVNSRNKGSDPFKWALLIAIGYQCFEVPRYRDYHGIVASYEDVKGWIKAEADLGTHDGDCDYVSLFCGTYGEYVSGRAALAKAEGT